MTSANSLPTLTTVASWVIFGECSPDGVEWGLGAER
jgi:hypothetical protein